MAFSTRLGGVSEGPYESLNLGILTDDDPARVARNRELLAAAAGARPGAVAMGWQVHGTDVKVHEGRPAGPHGYGKPGAELAKVDGHVTLSEDLALLVLVADCLPVALSGPGASRWSTAAGAAWRAGSRGRRGPSPSRRPPRSVPGSGACCYEVGEEVLARVRRPHAATAERMLDLERSRRPA